MKEAKAKKVFSQMLNQEEYKRLFEFFTTEVPRLALQVCQVREFPSVDKLLKQHKKTSFNVKSEYAKVSQKNQVLIKTYAANFNRLLNQALLEESTQADFITQFFANPKDVTRCCIPFKVYSKKLAFNASKVCVSYSKVEKPAIVLSFSLIRHLVAWSQDD